MASEGTDFQAQVLVDEQSEERRDSTKIQSKLTQILKFSWKNESKIVYLACVLLAVGVTWLANCWPRDDSSGTAHWWANVLDPFISLVTVALAAGLWLSRLNMRWRESLKKTLTVHFVTASGSVGNEQGYVYSCYNAYLSAESDIRAWGQQIGHQMNGKYLDFFPYITESGPLLVQGKGAYTQAYEVTFYLRQGGNEGYTVWYKSDERANENKEVRLSARPKTALTPDEAEAERARESEK